MVFIKKPLIMFSICLVLFSVAGCKNDRTGTLNEQTQSDRPPALKILYQDKSIDAKTGTYSWDVDNNDGSQTGIEYDSVAPPELVKNLTPLTVPPKSSLTLSFGNKPTDIAVNIWQDNKPTRQLIADNKITVPEVKGSVIYEVTGTWKQGIVHYAFSVSVE